jgi:hypothetical protein
MKNQEARRAKVVVIVAPVNGVESLHFCSTALKGYTECDPVSGFKDGGEDKWFPIRQGLFVTIEVLLVAFGIAHNVTSVSELRECGESTDSEVVYTTAA